MKIASTLFLLLLATTCVRSQSTQQEQRQSNDSIKKVVVARDTPPMLQPIPKDWYIKAAVNDSDVADFNTKCVVFALYSTRN